MEFEVDSVQKRIARQSFSREYIYDQIFRSR